MALDLGGMMKKLNPAILLQVLEKYVQRRASALLRQLRMQEGRTR